jgi:hypothetical protein
VHLCIVVVAVLIVGRAVSIIVGDSRSSRVVIVVAARVIVVAARVIVVAGRVIVVAGRVIVVRNYRRSRATDGTGPI